MRINLGLEQPKKVEEFGNISYSQEHMMRLMSKESCKSIDWDLPLGPVEAYKEHNSTTCSRCLSLLHKF